MTRKNEPVNADQVRQDDRTIEKLRNDEPVSGEAAEALKALRDDVREGEDR